MLPEHTRPTISLDLMRRRQRDCAYRRWVGQVRAGGLITLDQNPHVFDERLCG